MVKKKSLKNSLKKLLKIKRNNKYHKGELNVKLKRGQSFRDTAFMGIMRWTFYNRLKNIYPNVELTYGYITKNTRDRKSTRLNSSHVKISYAVFCLKKKKRI